MLQGLCSVRVHRSTPFMLRNKEERGVLKLLWVGGFLEGKAERETYIWRFYLEWLYSDLSGSSKIVSAAHTMAQLTTHLWLSAEISIWTKLQVCWLDITRTVLEWMWAQSYHIIMLHRGLATKGILHKSHSISIRAWNFWTTPIFQYCLPYRNKPI